MVKSHGVRLLDLHEHVPECPERHSTDVVAPISRGRLRRERGAAVGHAAHHVTAVLGLVAQGVGQIDVDVGQVQHLGSGGTWLKGGRYVLTCLSVFAVCGVHTYFWQHGCLNGRLALRNFDRPRVEFGRVSATRPGHDQTADPRGAEAGTVPVDVHQRRLGENTRIGPWMVLF